jgi:uncharacterized membrane protein
MSDDGDLRAAAARERQVIVFGLALIVTYLIVAFVPDLVPSGARQNVAVFAHARVISVASPSPQPSDQPGGSGQPQSSDGVVPSGAVIPSDQALPSDAAGPVGSPDLGTGIGTGIGPGDGTGGTGAGGTGVNGAGAGTAGGGGTGSGEAPPLATVLFLDGPLAGQQGQGLIQGPSGALELPDYRPGDNVIVEIDPNGDGTQSYSVVDRWRIPLFGVLCGIVTVLAAAVAGWRGLRAIASLALTLVLTVRLFVPLVILGWNPVPLAIVFGIVVTVLSFMLTQGFSRTTLSAIAGTTIGLGITGVLAVIVTAAAQFTPAQGSEEVVYLNQLTNGKLDLSGLLLAAVIFGGLGILNDVAVSQAATVEELWRADPMLSRRELFSRTMNVGTAHLAATINTLVFAYLGTALPLVVLLALQASNAGASISLESVAVEITRTLVGAIGILAAVPITTLIAVRWVTGQRPRRARAAQARALPRT